MGFTVSTQNGSVGVYGNDGIVVFVILSYLNRGNTITIGVSWLIH
jgi:hypothetical protein